MPSHPSFLLKIKIKHLYSTHSLSLSDWVESAISKAVCQWTDWVESAISKAKVCPWTDWLKEECGRAQSIPHSVSMRDYYINLASSPATKENVYTRLHLGRLLLVIDGPLALDSAARLRSIGNGWAVLGEAESVLFSLEELLVDCNLHVESDLERKSVLVSLSVKTLNVKLNTLNVKA